MEQQESHVSLKSFLNECVNSCDSENVRLELERKLAAIQAGLHNDEVVNLLKFVARLHGLPNQLAGSLLLAVHCNTPIDIKLKLKSAYILKYCLMHDDQFVSIRHLCEHLYSYHDNDFEDFFAKEIISQLILAILNFDCDRISHQEFSTKCIKTFRQHVNPRHKHEIVNLLKQFRDEGSASLLDSRSKDGKCFVQSGGHVIKSFHQNKASGSKVTAHSVKTQQTQVETFHANISEKSQIQNINIANALNESRSKLKLMKKNYESEINPAKRLSGSDQKWYRTTYYEVENLLKIAKSDDIVKDKDVLYLKERFLGTKYTIASELTIMETIANIFALISKNQVLTSDILECVASKALAEERDQTWDKCRIHVLKTIELQSVRNDGNISENLECILKKFKRSNECNGQMKKVIWNAIRKDDNYFEKFTDALDIIKAKPDDCAEELDYVAQQVSIQMRCDELYKQFPFFIPQLLEIVVNKECLFPSTARLQAAEAIEHYSAHKSSDTLDCNSLESLLHSLQDVNHAENEINKRIEEVERIITNNSTSFSRLFSPALTLFNPLVSLITVPAELIFSLITEPLKHLTNSNSTAILNLLREKKKKVAWTEQDRQKFECCLIRCFIQSLDKVIHSPKDISQVPTDLIPFLLKNCTEHVDKKVQVMIVCALSNWFNCRHLIAPVTNTEKQLLVKAFLSKLVRQDIVSESGDIVLQEDLEHEPLERFTDFTYISTIILKIFVVQAEYNDPDVLTEDVLRRVAQCLTDSQDKQTRIYCAEYLFYAAAKLMFNDLVLKSLQDGTLDSVIDIKVYCRAAYCIGLAKIVRTCDECISTDHLNWLPRVYEIDRLCLQDNNGKWKDYTSYVNPNILFVLKEMAKYEVIFSEEIFQLLALILNTKGLEGNCENVVENILSCIRQYQQAHKVIPQCCVEAVENTLMASQLNFESYADILESCVVSGQWLSDSILTKFVNSLYCGEGAHFRSKLLETLLIANNNQELPENVFQTLRMELVGKELLDLVDFYKSTLLENHCNWSITLFESLVRFLSNGEKLSGLTVCALKNYLVAEVNLHQVVDCITLAIENDQCLPSELIQIALQKSWKVSKSSMMQLAIAVAQHNQKLPASFLDDLWADMEAGNTKQVSFLITTLIQNHYEVPEMVIKEFLQYVNEQDDLLIDNLSAVIALLESKALKETDLQSICKKILLPALDHTNPTIKEFGIKGLLNYPQSLSEVDRELIISVCLTSNISTDVKDHVVQFLQEDYATFGICFLIKASNHNTLNDTEFIDCIRNAVLSKITCKFAAYSLDPGCYERLRNILNTNKEAVEVLSESLKILSNDELKIENFKMLWLSEIVDLVSFCMVNSPVQAIQELCHTTLLYLTHKKIQFSEKSLKYFFSTRWNLAWSADVNNLLNEIKQNQDVSPFLLSSCEQHGLMEKWASQIEPDDYQQQPSLDMRTKVGQLIEIVGAKSEHDRCDQLLDCDTLHEISRYIILNKHRWKKLEHISFLNNTFQILENAILINLENISSLVIAAYEVLINHCKSRSSECVEKMAEYFNDCVNDSYEAEKLLAILKCFVTLTKLGLDLPNSVLDILLEQIDCEVARTRSLCFQGIRNLKLKPEVKALWSTLFPTLTSQIQQEIYGKDKVCSQVHIFDDDMLQTLYSVTVWDLENLRAVDKSQWRQHLIINDFIYNIIRAVNKTANGYIFSVSEKSRVSILLSKMFELFGVDVAEQIVQMLSNQLFLLGNPSREIISIVMSIIDLKSDVILDILHYQEHSKVWLNQIELLSLANMIQSKSRQIRQEVSLRLAEKLHVSVRIDIAQKILQCISHIDNVTFFEDLVEFAGKHEVNDLFCALTSLRKTVTVVEFKTYLEVGMLMKYIPPIFELKREFELNLKNLLTKGFNFIDCMELMKRENSRFLDLNSCEILHNVFYQICQYNASKTEIEQLFEELRQGELTSWQSICHHFVITNTFKSLKGVKTLKKLLEEFRAANPKFQIHEDMLVALSQITSSNNPISGWNEGEIKKWATSVKHKRLSDMRFVEEAVMVARQACFLCKHFFLTDVQILCCLLSFENSKTCNGLLQQVATGSGKSAIIAVIALIKALQNIRIDIYTSNPVLAERDAKEWAPFYHLFNVSCDHNGDKGSSYITGEKNCYKNDIVYGDTAQFQFDALRDEYSDLKTRANRKYECAIVDEVDSMFIDDSSKLARLSSTLPGMDLLQPAYHAIWERLHFIQAHLLAVSDKMYYLDGKLEKTGNMISYYFTDEKQEIKRIEDIVSYIVTNGNLELIGIHYVNDIEPFVMTHLHQYAAALIGKNCFSEKQSVNSHIKLPKHLQAYAESQISNWVESALTAFVFQEKVHYIVDDGQIKPVDYSTTGVIQSSTSWNNGLQQFLQIKHSLKITTETVTTNFLSNMAMFKKYGLNVLGFTGTLGSDASKLLLSNIYKVECLLIPERFFKAFFRLPDMVMNSEEEWLQKVVYSCMNEAQNKRGVLIICETIQHAEMIHKALLEQPKKMCIKLYTKNNARQERQVERVHPGDVIVATNLAGRGTDIKADEIDQYGGLHVCLTFMPDSLRVEEQAFGRTSRQGKKGTGQLVIVGSKEMSQRCIRDENEKRTLEAFSNNDLKLITRKDSLFQKFCICFRNIRQNLRDNPFDSYSIVAGTKNLFNFSTLTTLELTVLLAIEERWALFLKQLDDNKWNDEQALDKYNTFEKEVREGMNNDDDLVRMKNSISLTQNCFYWIQIGNEYFLRDGKINSNAKKARTYFQLAIDLDPDFAAAALVGHAYTLLKKGEKAMLSSCHEENYKLEALRLLRQALPPLYQEIALVSFTQTLLLNRGMAMDSDLFHQLTEKSNLVGMFAHNIESIISVVEKSLRRVYCTGINEDGSETVLLANGATDLPLSSDYDNYRLEFRDLTHWQDCGTHDQAINALKTKTKNQKRVSLNFTDQNLETVSKCASSVSKISVSYKVIELNLDILESLTEKLQCASYTLEISAKLEDLKTLAMSDVLNTVTTILTYTVGSDENAATLTKKLLPPILESWDKPPNSATHVNTHFIIDADSQNKQSIVDIVKWCANKVNKYAMSLTLNDIELVTVESVWNVLKNCGRNVIQLSNLSERIAIKVIPKLREQNLEFVLQLHSPSLKDTEEVLKNADLKQEDIQQTGCKQMSQLFSSDSIPLDELRELAARGILLVATFNEKRFVPWRSIIGIAILGSIQVVVGAGLICTGFGATVGMGLITEGMADYTVCLTAYSNRHFSWADYSKQKAVSLVISAVSMGMQQLKDGAKGVKMAVQGAANEAMEQAGTKLVLNGRSIGATIQATGKNLKVLAAKEVFVKVGETGGRAAINTVVDAVVNFSFDEIKQHIVKEVEDAIKQQFSEPCFKQALSKCYAMDVYRGTDTLKNKVNNCVACTTNPQSTFWTREWNSVGWPLCRGILADPKYLGNKFSLLTRSCGVISGMKEIVSVTQRVCKEILKNLEEESSADNVVQVLYNFPSKQASQLIQMTTFQKDFKLTNFPTQSELTMAFPDTQTDSWVKDIPELFSALNKHQKKFDSKSTNISLLRKCVSNAIAEHIIQTANSQLVSPITTLAVGSFVSAISAELQHRFFVNEEHFTQEQREILEKVKDLKARKDLTSEEQLFLKENDQKYTIDNQINANAKDHNVAYTQAQIISKINEMTTGSGSNVLTKLSTTAKESLNDILNDKPADISTMFLLAQMEGLNIKIVDDPNYVLTEDDAKSGIQIIIFERPTHGSSIGHYSIKNTNTGEVEILPSTGENDCGYAVISALTGKAVADLRCTACLYAVQNIKTFEEVQECRYWIKDRYPVEASNFLCLGGAKKPRPKEEEFQDQEGFKVKGKKFCIDGEELYLPTEVEFDVELTGPVGSHAKKTSTARQLAKIISGDDFEVKTKNGETIKFSKTKVIAFHLKNRKQGGVGDSRNLIPATSSCNTLYFHNFEDHINDLRAEFKDKGLEASFHVRAKIRYADLQSQSSSKKYPFPEKIQVIVGINNVSNHPDVTDRFNATFTELIRNFNPVYRKTEDGSFSTIFINTSPADVDGEASSVSTDVDSRPFH